MAAAIPFLIIGGAVISAAGAMSAAKAQAAAANYNAQQSTTNAQTALDQARANVDSHQRQASQVQGSLIANVGASGVTMEGSPSDVLRMSVANASLDEQNMLYAARVKATGYYNDAALNRFSGKTAIQQGYYNAASSLLTGAGRAGYGAAMSQKGTPISPDSSPANSSEPFYEDRERSAR